MMILLQLLCPSYFHRTVFLFSWKNKNDSYLENILNNLDQLFEKLQVFFLDSLTLFDHITNRRFKVKVFIILLRNFFFLNLGIFTSERFRLSKMLFLYQVHIVLQPFVAIASICCCHQILNYFVFSNIYIFSKHLMLLLCFIVN